MNTRLWLVAFYTLLIGVSACKEEENKEIIFTGIESSADPSNKLDITYGLNGELNRIDQPGFSIQFFYKNDKLSYRKTFNGNNLSSIDTLFTDGNGKILKADTYDDANVKVSTTSLSYNSDNTLNTVLIDFDNILTDDQSFEYTYANGQVSQRIKSRRIGSEYRVVQKTEILSYDQMSNPWDKVFQPYLVLNLEASPIIWAGPGRNPVSIKDSSIDPISGSVSSVTVNTLSYQYDENGYPSVLSVDGTPTYNYKYTVR